MIRAWVPYFYRNIAILLGKIQAVAIECFEHRAPAADPQALLENVPVSDHATHTNRRGAGDGRSGEVGREALIEQGAGVGRSGVVRRGAGAGRGAVVRRDAGAG